MLNDDGDNTGQRYRFTGKVFILQCLVLCLDAIVSLHCGMILVVPIDMLLPTSREVIASIVQ